MLLLTSPRLPGISLLQAQSTSPEYSRWRRHIEYVLQSKGTWKYCNGRCTMPMPEAGATSPTTKTTNIQPSLLQERRSWVKCDREVKLDIFLSLSEEVMQEVFEVGPPLPPSNLNAQQMLQALDEHFAIFKFEAYHHVFCHFLNLHIDQYPSIEDFNQEFLATLEDLLDHGHPLSNIQACSAYFSKLRCTQNPWVAQKLEEWDAQTGEIECIDLLKDSPPWSIIRPLATKPSQNFHVESIPEEYLDNSSTSDNEVRSIETIATTACTHAVLRVVLFKVRGRKRVDHSAQNQPRPDIRRKSLFTHLPKILPRWTLKLSAGTSRNSVHPPHRSMPFQRVRYQVLYSAMMQVQKPPLQSGSRRGRVWLEERCHHRTTDHFHPYHSRHSRQRISSRARYHQ
jgi:hypothetical protein